VTKPSECSHSWRRLDEPRPSYADPGVYRCEHCGYTFAEIGAAGALVRMLKEERNAE
jgi:hypothetical protein